MNNESLPVPVWRVHLFGETQFFRQDDTTPAPIRFSTQKTRQLLFFLLLHSHRNHSRERLAELFWPGTRPDSARTNLRTALADLRDVLNDRVGETRASRLFRAERQTLSVTPGAFSTDVADFNALFRRGDSSETNTERIACYKAIVMLYRGPLLLEEDDLNPEDNWLSTARTEYASKYLSVLLQLTTLYEAQGDLPKALFFAHMATKVDSNIEQSKRRFGELFVYLQQQLQAKVPYLTEQLFPSPTSINS